MTMESLILNALAQYGIPAGLLGVIVGWGLKALSALQRQSEDREKALMEFVMKVAPTMEKLCVDTAHIRNAVESCETRKGNIHG